jgi:hypothetical protein
MVKGLDRFREYFLSFNDQYVLIGGTACSLVMQEAGLDFRSTKDLDIVLSVEALNSKFVETFWKFIKKGKYQNKQKSTGKKIFYRFYSPEDPSFPEMLELFSKKPKSVFLGNESHLTPIPIDEEISSLSAILLDENYYHFIHTGKRDVEGLSVISPEYLIPLKALAWVNLSKKLAEGNMIDEKNIRKHKNDVFRLYQLLAPSTQISLPQSAKLDMQKFIEGIKAGSPVDLKSLGLSSTTLSTVLNNLVQIYKL